jgi:hypothetical protein
MRKAIILMTVLMGFGMYSQEFSHNINFKPIDFNTDLKKIDGVYFYKPSRFFKLSMKPTVNYGQAYHLLNSNSNFDTNDYFKVGKVDMRIKFYLHPRIHLVMGSQISGTGNYTYTTGVIIKLN